MLTLLGGLILIFFNACSAQNQSEAILEAPQPKQKEHIQLDAMPEPQNLIEVQREIGYPKAARENNIQGKVMVKILVDQNGAYEKHEILSSADETLTKAVEAHLSKLEFTAPQKDGKAVKAWVTLPFSFKFVD